MIRGVNRVRDVNVVTTGGAVQAGRQDERRNRRRAAKNPSAQSTMSGLD
jgi:hypothetical protein